MSDFGVQNLVRIISQGVFSKNISVLRDGFSVSFRVIEKMPSNLYVVSIFGRKILVQSEKTLKTGQIFYGKIKINNGKILISVQNDFSEKKSSCQILKDRLLAMGLSFDPETLRLLNFSKDLGIKIDPEKIKRFLRFKKKSKNARDSDFFSLLADEKGILAESDFVDSIAKMFCDERRKKNQSFNEKKLKISEKNEKSKEFAESFFLTVNDALNLPCRSLSIFNTLLKSRAKNSDFKHWVFLPFIWEEMNAHGDFRILQKFSFDFQKTLEKIVINCKTQNHIYGFSLKFSKKNLFAVDFSVFDLDSFGKRCKIDENSAKKMIEILHKFLADFNFNGENCAVNFCDSFLENDFGEDQSFEEVCCLEI